MSRIAVIGAGLAGLSLAARLHRSGVSCTLFDKGRGPGGRSSRRRENGYEFDHGAQYFTVDNPRFVEQVDDWRNRGQVARWEGHIVSIESGGRIQECSPKERFVGVPGMNAMAADLSRDLDLHFESRVEGLRRERDGWWLIWENDGTAGPFELVVVTTPPAQALAFVQAAEMLTRIARSVKMLPCWAAMLAFEGRLEFDFDGAFVNEGPLSWVARNSSKPGRPDRECWVLHAGPQWTREHLELEREQVARVLLEELGRARGLNALPAPVHVQAHLWRYAQPERSAPESFYWDPELGLALGGDWCGGPKLGGAWQSGFDLAEAVLRN